jgi:hypothetical protein
MSIFGATSLLNSYNGTSCGGCPPKDNCPPNVCPDFTLKRHDTKPGFKVLVEDCDGPLDLTDENLVVEVNIWCKAKLKKDISISDTYFSLGNNVGFDQIMIGDVIIMDRVRRPEYMLVIAFDEDNKLVEVQRGYQGTSISAWKKGTSMKIYRTMNANAQIETVVSDHVKEDGTKIYDQVQQTYLVYNWNVKDTCTPGCYWLEFKLLSMTPLQAESDSFTIDVNTETIFNVLANDSSPAGGSLSLFSVSPPAHGVASISSDNKIVYTPDSDYVGEDIFTYVITDGLRQQAATISVNVTNPQVQIMSIDDTPSNISFTPTNLSYTDFGCFIGAGVDWVRRFPVSSDGFLIKIIDSQNTE